MADVPFDENTNYNKTSGPRPIIYNDIWVISRMFEVVFDI